MGMVGVFKGKWPLRLSSALLAAQLAARPSCCCSRPPGDANTSWSTPSVYRLPLSFNVLIFSYPSVADTGMAMHPGLLRQRKQLSRVHPQSVRGLPDPGLWMRARDATQCWWQAELRITAEQ